MRLLVILVFFMYLLLSCKDETSYQLQILIKNEANVDLKIKLFPKSKYMSGDLYDFSGIGSGHRNTEFQVETNLEMSLYISGDLNIKPYILVTQVFDSIIIIPMEENKTEIKFSPDTVIGYSDNLYNDSSEWIYEVRNFDLPVMFQRNPVESHDYIYVISRDRD